MGSPESAAPIPTPKALAKQYRDHLEHDPLDIATLLSRQGIPDALVDDTVRRILDWRLKRDKVTPSGYFLDGQALERRAWRDSDAELMGVFPFYLKTQPPPAPKMVPQYDVYAERVRMVPADPIPAWLARSDDPVAPEEQQRIEEQRRQHDEWLARTKDERERAARQRAVEDGEYPSPPEHRVPYSGPGKVLAQEVEAANILWSNLTQRKRPLYPVDPLREEVVPTSPDVEQVVGGLVAMLGEDFPGEEQLLEWAENKRLADRDAQKAERAKRAAAKRRATRQEVRQRLGGVCRLASAACTADGMLQLHRKAGGGTQLREKVSREQEWAEAFALGEAVARQYELLCPRHHTEVDHPRHVAGGRIGGLRSGVARRRLSGRRRTI